MYDRISQMEPLHPAANERLEDLGRSLVERSARLDAGIHPDTTRGVVELLRVVNSYYSNLIEGNATHPVDIERAMRQDYLADADKRDRQIESGIHIQVQRELAARLDEAPATNVASADFLRWLHQAFYERMPERLRLIKAEDGRTLSVEPGRTRETTVAVGQHVPPLHTALPDFMRRFEQAYDPAAQHGVRPFITIAAAHHRLTWIHPFLDGNGRVSRLFVDAWMQRVGLTGYGLWNVSRGLARSRDQYRALLANADHPREGDLDGRGNLSQRQLLRFCEYFLETCIDQADFMSGLLRLDTFLTRLAGYVRLRKEAMLPTPADGAEMRPEVAAMLQECAIFGALPRNELATRAGVSERTGSRIFAELLREGLLASDRDRGPVRLGFPAHAASYWFPGLYPEPQTA